MSWTSRQDVTLERLLDSGFINQFDYHFVRMLTRRFGLTDSRVIVGIAAVSSRTSQGHVCVDLRELAGRLVMGPEGEKVPLLFWPEEDEWLTAMRQCPAIGFADGERETAGCGPDEEVNSDIVLRDGEETPLVRDCDDLFYFARYWRYQQQLVARIRRMSRPCERPPDPDMLRKALERWFPLTTAGDGEDPERQAGILSQRQAAVTAMTSQLAVISGGPGTGKTSTVVKLLMLAFMNSHGQGLPAPRVLMMAPTAKAAVRLRESISSAVAEALRMADEEERRILGQLPTATSTIHKALGWQYHTPTRFRHNARNPLAKDIVIVDETSMVDLAMLTKVIDAVPRNAKLILLGDRDQLASVEAGAVMADLCGHRGLRLHTRPTTEDRDINDPAKQDQTGEDGGRVTGNGDRTPLDDCIVNLTYSFRFGGQSAIGQLARAVNRGDVGECRRILDDGESPDVTHIAYESARDIPQLLERHVIGRFDEFLASDTPEEKLRSFNNARVLCAHRRGPDGEETINRLLEKRLRSADYGDNYDRLWYHGKPVMVLVNDYQQALFNGDIGIILRVKDGEERLMTFFSQPEGGLRQISPTRLPEHRTVYALTVHKSQGSEYNDVIVILPANPSPVTTRELLYTAITRARQSVTIIAPHHVLEHAIVTNIQRRSGLARQLRPWTLPPR